MVHQIKLKNVNNSTLFTHRQTDRHTDRQTDRQTAFFSNDFSWTFFLFHVEKNKILKGFI